MSDTKEVLCALAMECKSQYLMLAAILNELAALRETVRALDPTFSDVLTERQKDAADSTRELVHQRSEVLSKLIEKAQLL